jgi:hypothetical protein
MSEQYTVTVEYLLKKKKIGETAGRFFSILYKNKKGETNNYVVRTGVKKHLKGGTNNCPNNAVTLYAVTKNGKREEIGYKTMYVDNIILK